MSRYVADEPAAARIANRGPMLPSLTVDGPKRIDTGLLDAAGRKIMRLQPPIGFGRDEEW